MNLVTLCSGGLDSVTLAYYLRSEGVSQTLLFVDYGQRHIKEYECARECADRLDVPIRTVKISGGGLFKSALTIPGATLPTGKYEPQGIGVTVVPNRNAVLASLAASLAVSLDYDGIALAVHAGDYAVYPDTTPEFVTQLQRLLQVATGRPSFFTRAPWLRVTKAEVVFKGHLLGVPFEDTWSCYAGGDVHCGVCSTCIERRAAFVLASIPDPTIYHQGG